MDYSAILERILGTVDDRAYLTPTAHIDDSQRDAMRLIEHSIQGDGFKPDETRALARRLYDGGVIDRVMYLSALHVVAADPRVANWTEAARLAGEQEQAALELGGPNLADNLASVDRHRGVLAFLQGHYAFALDYLSRAFERQRTPENLGNVLCALLRLGEIEEAEDLTLKVRGGFPRGFVRELETRIENDPDLALLCREDS